MNPTLRIVVRTRWLAEVEPLSAAGVDRVVSEELESVIALFDDVLVSYRVSPREIGEHEGALRGGSYALLRAPRPQLEASSLVEDWECALGPDCFDSRTVTLRPGARRRRPRLGRAAPPPARGALGGGGGVAPRRPRGAGAGAGARPAARRRGGADGAAGALRRRRRAVPHAAGGGRSEGGDGGGRRRRATPDRCRCVDGSRAGRRRGGLTGTGFLDTEATVELHPADPTACGHLDQVHPVRPSAAGCEECLAAGDRWVHLRLCMTCGHVGCCDSSPNRHATAHFHATGHPVVRSVQPGEEWGWCYVDETML